MKIFINAKTKEHAWGGGNQFLKALRTALMRKGFAVASAQEADVILYNSYQELGALVYSYLFTPRKKRVYRLGPVMALHRAGWKWKVVDRLMVFAANVCAEMVIFQSQWSYSQARARGFRTKKKYSVIYNAVDQSVFYTKEKTTTEPLSKIKLLYTSWSSNKNKGFSYLTYLDNHLDFEKYSVTFIGNTPVVFKNIITVAPLASIALAEELRHSDIFISPTKDDACSNAILEALSCGLPVVALDSGANRELVGQGGTLFSSTEDMIGAIDTVAQNLATYQSRIVTKNIDTIADEYIAVIHDSIT